MDYIAKADWDIECITDKLYREAEGIEVEIQSANDKFLSKDWHLDKGIYKYIRALHLPKFVNTAYNAQSCNIDTEIGLNYLKLFADRAERLMLFMNKSMVVISHIGRTKEQLTKLNEYTDIISRIDEICYAHPDITFVFENNSRELLSPLQVLQLICDLHADNVGACLNTCHALMVDRQTFEDNTTADITYEDHFRILGARIKWLELSNARKINNKYGLDFGHNALFDEDMFGRVKLYRTILLINRYLKNIDAMTLNIVEDKSDTGINYSIMRKEIIQAFADFESKYVGLK